MLSASRPWIFLLLLLGVACAPTDVDVDGDGFAVGEDCDDAAVAVHPGADEVCDGVDNDCSGEVDDAPIDAPTWYRDADGDGHPGEAEARVACSPPPGFGPTADDCDDTNAASWPGAEELCDGLDNDCSGEPRRTERDDDGDGFLDCAECDDDDPQSHPGAEELCDGTDNDCDGEADEEGSWFADTDLDGYGTPTDLLRAPCDAPPAGYVGNDDDCDDADATRAGGLPEVCDPANVDEDCDGLADDEDDSVSAEGRATRYPDADRDGYGETDAPTLWCDVPASGYLEDGQDCDDTRAAVNPDGTEVCGDRLDNDCDGGAACPLYGTVDLSSADARLLGWGGSTVAGVGDVNGDGYDDVLVGSYTGAALAYGPLSGDVDLSRADAWLIEDGGFIRAAAGVGDVDGDGLADVAIGQGYAYVFSGPLTGGLEMSEADARLAGNFGVGCVAGAGDVNGDGYTDLILGTPDDDHGGDYAGAAPLVYGPVSGEFDLSFPDAKLIGENEEDFVGWAVSSAGDVNDDLYGDLLVGSTENDDGGKWAGSAWLVRGPLSGNVNLSDADAQLVGENPTDLAGGSLSGAGDVDGDAYADFLVGAVGSGAGGADAGSAYLVFGPVSSDLDLAAADVEYQGEPDDGLGASVSAAGDINADGHDDFLLGAPGHGDPGPAAGAAYLVFGPVRREPDPPLAVVELRGEAMYDYAGQSVASAGDVNADGYADLVIGAPGYGADDSDGLSMGAAYVVYGGRGL